MAGQLLLPSRDRGRSLLYQPLVLAGALDAVAIGRGTLPGRAVAERIMLRIQLDALFVEFLPVVS